MILKKYIHYGSNAFDIDKFDQVKNDLYASIFKPIGGFWASPVDSENNWHNWCINNNFRIDELNKSFVFTLLPNSRILSIHTMNDINNAIRQQCRLPLHARSSRGIDFEGLIHLGYDAVEVYLDDFDVWQYFYGWDVDSIFIMNPSCMRIVSNDIQNR